jgi:hypothetical protein
MLFGVRDFALISFRMQSENNISLWFAQRELSPKGFLVSIGGWAQQSPKEDGELTLYMPHSSGSPGTST